MSKKSKKSLWKRFTVWCATFQNNLTVGPTPTTKAPQIRSIPAAKKTSKKSLKKSR